MKIIKYKRIFLYNLIYVIMFIHVSNAFARRNNITDTPSNAQFIQEDKYAIVEAYSDDVIHIETAAKKFYNFNSKIYTSPMIANSPYFKGAESFQKNGNTIETKNISIRVNSDLCLEFYNKKSAYYLANICPDSIDQATKTLKIYSAQNKNAYGLGQYFYDPNTANGDWVGRKWEPGEFGNTFAGFAGGAHSKIQFPILYALGEGNNNYAIFIDNQYKMSWDFTNSQEWRVSMWGDQIRYFIISGENLEELRQKYLRLTGLPLLPPKKMLGLWVSEYGYQNWDEVRSKLSHLRSNHFPVDGFALDLYWFGGTKGMGTVTFDPVKFPNPELNLKKFKAQGVEFLPIQESYISDSAISPNSSKTEYEELYTHCYLVRQNNHNCNPSYFKNTWWGSGGMLDWTNENAADYWFQKKEIPLINLGINQFWLDLNEPEMYDPNSYYYGININGTLKNRHADVANLYAFKWIESLNRGYQKHAQDPNFKFRPIFISRAGAPGMQRFGAGMWSGDIGANLGGLKAHINNQMNVSLSGIDFYSADTGGFHRNVFDGTDIHRLYTMWFANAAVFDFPVRPHTWVGETDNSETSPSLIGNLEANRENIIQRYKLFPYYYSLFYRAYLYGEAVIPPLVSIFQNDSEARKNSSEKMIGKYLLGSTVYQYQNPIRKGIYLPEGRWLNFHTLDEVTKKGKVYIDFPIYIENKYKIPLFIREGAIIPQMHVDEKSLNISGLREDGTKNNDLGIRIFPSENATKFTLYEDDGETNDYKSALFSQTEITQVRNKNHINIVLYPTKGIFNGSINQRNITLELALPNEQINEVFIDNLKITQCSNQLKTNCWMPLKRNLYSIKLDNFEKNKKSNIQISVSKLLQNYTQYSFTCLNGHTNPGESVYILGNISELGNWEKKKAIKLSPTEYPTWTVYLPNLPTNTQNIEWKCIRLNEQNNNIIQWQHGNNNKFNSIETGYGGNLTAAF